MAVFKTTVPKIWDAAVKLVAAASKVAIIKDYYSSSPKESN
jgi:hypothetical protein